MHSSIEISQLDLEVWCSETLLYAPSILGNLAGVSVYLDKADCAMAALETLFQQH